MRTSERVLLDNAWDAHQSRTGAFYARRDEAYRDAFEAGWVARGRVPAPDMPKSAEGSRAAPVKQSTPSAMRRRR
jgi:hypothetical protein